MQEQLPITISASLNLLAHYKQLNSAINRQEAQINFQTLAAGWYENEKNITTINIFLVFSNEYQPQINTDNVGIKADVADDVCLFIEGATVSCYIAITDPEKIMIDDSPKILLSYLTVKIKKVINEIADKKGLRALD